MTCVVCAGASGHPPILEDGDPACYPCIIRIGRLVADPSQLSQGEYHLIDEMHGDQVKLAWNPSRGSFEWVWIARWPAADRSAL